MDLRRLVPWTLLLVVAPCLVGWNQLTVDPSARDALGLRFTTHTDVLYHVHGGGAPGVPVARVRAAIDRAFTTWEQDCSTLQFSRDPQGRDADTPAQDGQNVLRFETRALPRDVDPDSVLAFTLHVGVFCTGVIVESDITFNAVTVAWSDAVNVDEADIETVALHEIGHLLGLDHSPSEFAVMYPTIVERVRRDLSRDDLDAVCTIYDPALGADCERTPDCAGGEVCQVLARSDESVAVQCSAPLGVARPGQRCDPDADYCDNGCANGLCLENGTCSAVCRTDADCPVDLICAPQQLPGPVNYRTCAAIDLCEDDIDDCGAGAVCLVTEHPSEQRPLRYCAPSEGDGVGESCRNADTCAGGLCLDGLCTATCDNDGDCPAPFQCSGVPVEFDGFEAEVRACALDTRPCGAPRDCPEGLECRFRNTGQATVSECGLGAGGAPGTRCQNGGGCASGVCLRGACAGPCERDSDCPDGLVCGEANIFSRPTPTCIPEAAPTESDGGLPPDARGAPDDQGTSDPDPETEDASSGLDDAGGRDPSDLDASTVGAEAGAPPTGPGATRTGGSSGASSGCAFGGAGRQPAPWLAFVGLLWVARRRRALQRAATDNSR
jgi:hypothetical protein